MVTLTIDNQTITVPDGTSVLDAAEKLGIVVPHFCYHKALGPVGACRLCAVHIESEPGRGVQMSCLIEAAEGMVVNTLEPTAVELRQQVIEWLMTNHPHDCPVCDEGGECQLQDMTIAGGHGIRQYRGKKRTYRNQDLGPFIEQEMNRCIQCYRCVRTYRDYFGGDDFGVMGSRNRVFFGRFQPGRLQSPFAGNLADVCPTGVFTDKTFRFKSRYWDLQEADSICPHCSLGCATIPGASYRELQRTRAGVNEKVNGYFICDRGRFGYGYVNHPQRPRLARAGGSEISWSEALRLSRSALAKLTDELGGSAVAWLGSPRASLEANYLLKGWAAKHGSKQTVFECHPQRDRTARTWIAGRGKTGRSLADISSSDFILLVGSDPLNEAPMLAAAIRQAVRKGAQVAVLDVRPVKLPFQASHLVVQPERLPAMLHSLADQKLVGFERHELLFLEAVQQRLQNAARPILVGGADLLQTVGVETLLYSAGKLSTAEKVCGTFVHLAGPNSYGAAMLAGAGPCFETVLDGILDGKIRGLVCLESDPFHDYPDPARVQAALSRLEVLVVMDYLGGEATRLADIFLPTTAPPETAGTFINCEGRMQQFAPVMEPGEPLSVTGEGDHPPRTFSRQTPGAEPRSAVSLLSELLATDPDLEQLRLQIVASDNRFNNLENDYPGSEGQLCSSGGEGPPAAETQLKDDDASLLKLLPVSDLFGSGVLSAYASALDAVRGQPHVVLAQTDAAELKIASGETVVLQTALGRMHVTVEVDAKAVAGLVLLPQVEGAGSGVFLPGAGTFACRLLKEDLVITPEGAK